ncbi:MAG: Cna B-type domain-containing protein, partial [Eubacteriaceae bacterium]|nr:Cna B-type domain-containing protein [Eubacteriaceae bacterium]
TTKDTTHDYYDAALSDDGTSTGNGILKWGIELTIPSDIANDMVVTEKLPAGVTLYESERVAALTMKDANNVTDTFIGFSTDNDNLVQDGSTATVTFQGETVTATYDRDTRTVTWTIPVALAKKYLDKRLDYYIAVKVDPDMIPSSDTGYNTRSFKNTVTVNIDDHEAGSVSHTQVISKDDRHDALSKSCNVRDPYLEYTLDINPNGKDYLKNSNTLTIEDVFKYTTGNRDASMSLMPASVTLYEVDGTTETKIENFTYTFDHQSEKDYYNEYYYHTSKIEATVPDGKHLRLKYSYKANGEDGTWFNGLTNTATLKGIVTTNKAEQSLNQYSVKSSEAVSDTTETGIVIYKHDADDFTKKLSGAVFKLEKYDKESNNYTDLGNYTTDAKGQITFTHEDSTELTFNQAYRLTEITAPSGYRKNSTPYYFYIINTDKTRFPEVKPDDFQGTGYHNYETIYRPNRTMGGATSIHVKKRWIDKDGNETDAPAGETATFAVHQVERPFAANSKFILMNKDRTADLNESFNKLTSGGYAYGTKLNIQITNNEWNSGDKQLTVYEEDGTKREFSSSYDNQQGKTTYTLNNYVVCGDMNWKVIFDGDPAHLDAEVTVSERGHTRFDDVYLQGVTVDAGGNWQTTVNDLPLYGIKNINGTLTDVAYAYYVEETAGPDGYLVHYSDDKQGVVEGNIVVTNQENLTDLELKKVWKNKEGQEIADKTNLPEAVFRLYRTGYSTEPGKMTLNLKKSDDAITSPTSDFSFNPEELVLDGYPQGTKITYALTYTDHGDYDKVDPSLKDDSENALKENPETVNLEGYQKKFTFTTVVGSDSSANSSYTLKLDHVNEGTKLERTSIEVPKPVEAKKAFPNARRNRIALNAENNWTLHVAGATSQLGALPKSKTEMVNGTPVTTYYYYQVEESEVNGYTTTYSANNEIGVQNGTITATNKRNNTNITVKKVWQDANGNDYNGTKPDSVTFDLYRRVSSEPVAATLTTDDIQNYTKPISYPEGTVLKYRLTYTNQYGDNPTVTRAYDSSEDIDIVRTGKTSTNNTYFDLTSTVHEGATYKLKLSDGNQNHWDLKLYSIDLPKLNGIDDTLIGTYHTTNGTWSSSDLTNTGQVTVDGKKQTGYYYYYVKEHPVDGFSVSYANNEGINAGEITITNKKLDSTIINVRKDWQKEDGTPATPTQDSISFKLMRNATRLISNKGIKVDTKTNMDNGSVTFKGINPTEYYASGSSLHYEITYTTEWGIPNLAVEVKNDNTSVSTNPEVTTTGGNGSPTIYTFDTGSLTAHTTILIKDTKSNNWSDPNGFEVKVSASKTSEDSLVETDPVPTTIGTYQISAANNWEWYSTDANLNLPESDWKEETIEGQQTNVPITYQYYIQEVDVPAGYEALYHVGTTAETSGKSNSIPLGNTATIVNQINSTSVTANKIWNGVESDDLANQPDAYVTLHRVLKAEDGTIITLNEDQVGGVVNLKDYKNDNKHPWSYTWTALPKSGTYNGVAGTWLYWVEEEAVADHTTAYRYVLPLDESITGDAEKTTAYQSDTFITPGAKHGINGGTFVIMNMKKTSIAVKKAWQNGSGETINPTDKQATVTLKRREKTYTAPTEKSISSNPPAINVRLMTKAGTVQEIYHISDDKVVGSPDGDGNFVAKITAKDPEANGGKYSLWYKFSGQSGLDLESGAEVVQLNTNDNFTATINLTIPKALLGETCINVDMLFKSYDFLERTKIYSGEIAIDKVTWTYGNETTVGSQILSADKGWTYTWNDLPTGNESSTAATQSTYEYWVEETPIAGYTATYSGKTIDGIYNVDLITSDDDNKTIAPHNTMTVITNKEVASSIAVKKVWKNAEGNVDTTHTDEVKVNVYREMVDASGNVITRTSGSDDITFEPVNYLFREKVTSGTPNNDPLTLDSSNQYKMDSKITPPLTGEYDGKTYSYQYTAKEVAIEAYDSKVTYEKQVEVDGNNLPTALNETITVTNTPKSNKFVLPSTGSMGLWVMMALGLGLMGCGAYLYKRKTGQKQNKPKDTSSGESG